MKGPKLTLSILPKQFAICRLSPDADIPAWSKNTELYSIPRSKDELSVACFEENAPLDVEAERDWRALRIEGPLDFSSTGILASLVSPLAKIEGEFSNLLVFCRKRGFSHSLSLETDAVEARHSSPPYKSLYFKRICILLN